MTTKLTKLLQSGLTVFTLNDLGIIWGQKDRSATRQSARDYASRGNIVRLHQGVYALPGVWPDDFKLANKLLAPSYVTGQSILAAAGLSYQYTDTVFSVALYNRSFQVQAKTFAYSQVKATVLYNTLGLTTASGASQASPERAITDLVYLSKGRFSFEPLSNINWELLANCAQIYENAWVVKAAATLRGQYA